MAAIRCKRSRTFATLLLLVLAIGLVTDRVVVEELKLHGRIFAQSLDIFYSANRGDGALEQSRNLTTNNIHDDDYDEYQQEIYRWDSPEEIERDAEIREYIEDMFNRNNWTGNIVSSSKKKNKKKSKPTLFLHVGPKKTASTTIQLGLLGSRKFRPMLLEDNIRVLKTKYNYLKVGKLISHCLIRETPQSCDNKILEEFYDTMYEHFLSKPGEMFVHTCETYAAMPRTRLTKLVFQRLMKDYNVKIIMVYRRFSSALPSDYYQYLKKTVFRSRSSTWRAFPRSRAEPPSLSFPEYADQIMQSGLTQEALTVYDFFASIFGRDSISVVDINAPDGVDVEFVCRGLQADRTCQYLKSNSNMKRKNKNDKFLFEQDLLVMEAHRRGFFEGKQLVGRRTAAKRLDSRLQALNFTLSRGSVLSFNSTVIPNSCLSREVERKLWERIRYTENRVAPNPLPIDQLQIEFNEDREKFCSVNASAVWQDETLRALMFDPCHFLPDDKSNNVMACTTD